MTARYLVLVVALLVAFAPVVGSASRSTSPGNLYLMMATAGVTSFIVTGTVGDDEQQADDPTPGDDHHVPGQDAEPVPGDYGEGTTDNPFVNTIVEEFDTKCLDTWGQFVAAVAINILGWPLERTLTAVRSAAIQLSKLPAAQPTFPGETRWIGWKDFAVDTEPLETPLHRFYKSAEKNRMVTSRGLNQKQRSILGTFAEQHPELVVKGAVPRMPPAAVGATTEVPAALGPRNIPAGDRGDVLHFPSHIDWVWTTGSGKNAHTNSAPVIDASLEVRGRYEIDGDSLFRVRVDGHEHVVTGRALLNRLVTAGNVVYHAVASDVLSLVLQEETRGQSVIRAHSAVGVYADDDGKLSLDLDPLPRLDSEANAVNEVRDSTTRKGTPDAVHAYLIDLPKLWHDFEYIPALGIASISPFALVLRKTKKLVPHVLHLSTESGIGKTTVATILTESLYGVLVVLADAVNSEHRITAHFNRVGCATTIDESEKLDEGRCGPALKGLAEQGVGNQRGTKELGQTTFWSRAVGIFTSQQLVFRTQSVLVRFLVVRFDERRKKERSSPDARVQLYGAVAKLVPLGWDMAQHAITMFPTLEALVASVNADEIAIDTAYRASGNAFTDPRRQTNWAMVYTGLRIWSSYAATLGVTWSPPTIQMFVTDVVEQVEATGDAGVRRPIHQFTAWFDSWLVKNRNTNGTVRGAEEIWKFGLAGRPPMGVPGRWLTDAALTEYNAHAEPSMRIGSLSDLNRLSAKEYNLPIEDVLDLKVSKAGGSRSIPYNVVGHNIRSAFIPLNHEPRPSETSGKTGSVPGEFTPAAAAAMNLRDLKWQGADREFLFYVLRAQGCSAKAAEKSLDELDAEFARATEAGGGQVL